MLPMNENSAANGTPDGPSKSGTGQGRLAASSPAGKKGDGQGSHSPQRGPQSSDGGRTVRDRGREGRAGGRGSRGQGGRHGRGRSGSPFVWQPPPGMEDGTGRGRGRGRGRSRGRGGWQDGSQGTHLWGGACTELQRASTVSAMMQVFNSSQALHLQQLLSKRARCCKGARHTLQRALNPADGASNQKEVSQMEYTSCIAKGTGKSRCGREPGDPNSKGILPAGRMHCMTPETDAGS